MSRRTTKLLKAALSALHYSGADDLVAPYVGGDGVILMLHHVTPDQPRDFEPNGILKVTPAFLESVIGEVRASGFEIIALDDVKARLATPEPKKPFAVFTLDDGYKDNRDHAYPVFKRHDVPFTIYVPAAYADGEGDLWWLVLEEALRRLSSVEVDRDGASAPTRSRPPKRRPRHFTTSTGGCGKCPKPRARAITRDLAMKAGFDPASLCRDLVMNWDEIRALAADPLVTIAAHTCHHFALAKLAFADAQREIADSVARIAKELGKPCRHFSYPYGDEGSAGTREFDIARSARHRDGGDDAQGPHS